jgi:anthranilate/para-aminobenzoate synthase component I
MTDATCNALSDWPHDRRLVALLSCRPHERWARRSILAEPAVTFRFDGRSHLLDAPPDWCEHITLTHDPLRDLDAVLDFTARHAAHHKTPTSGWVGVLSYELGRFLEPAVAVTPHRSRATWPEIELQWCPNVQTPEEITATAAAAAEPRARHDDISDITRIGALEPARTRAQYEADVRTIIAYIAAGDAFQVNLTQPWSAPFHGSTRALAECALRIAKPWYGAVIEARDGRTLISLSPELFLDLDPHSRRVVTRPIKGTRPAETDHRELHDSEKDTAELHMITDLMRNDLGRVCAFGSMSVDLPRTIEHHPTVQHGVSEVAGTLRNDITRGDLLRATFPPGSVTGAPKIRAMQIIEELEPRARGPYCGAVGWFGDDGAMTLSVAIRTLMLTGSHILRPDGRSAVDMFDGTLTYGAGGGIVADSLPAAEYEEHRHKMAVVEQTLRAIND